MTLTAAAWTEDLHPRGLDGRFIDVTMSFGDRWLTVIDNESGRTTTVPKDQRQVIHDYLNGSIPADRVVTGKKWAQIKDDEGGTIAFIPNDMVNILKALDRDGHFTDAADEGAEAPAPAPAEVPAAPLGKADLDALPVGTTILSGDAELTKQADGSWSSEAPAIPDAVLRSFGEPLDGEALTESSRWPGMYEVTYTNPKTGKTSLTSVIDSEGNMSAFTPGGAKVFFTDGSEDVADSVEAGADLLAAKASSATPDAAAAETKTPVDVSTLPQPVQNAIGVVTPEESVTESSRWPGMYEIHAADPLTGDRMLTAVADNNGNIAVWFPTVGGVVYLAGGDVNGQNVPSIEAGVAQMTKVFNPPTERFESKGDARDWAYSKWGDANLTPDEEEAVSDYTGSGYSDMNRSLRRRSAMSAAMKTRISLLDSAIEKAARFPEDTEVKRTMNWSKLAKEKGWPADIEEGFELRDLGFMSVAVGPQFVDASGSDTEIYLSVPKGSKGIYVSGDAVGDGRLSSVGAHENEIILPRGMTIRIVEVGPKVNGMRRVRAELVPAEE